LITSGSKKRSKILCQCCKTKHKLLSTVTTIPYWY